MVSSGYNLPRSVLKKGIDGIEVPDNGHGHGRLQERVGVDENEVEHLIDVVDKGKRMMNINPECRRYADRKRMQNPSDVYYVKDNFVYGFFREYKTFLEERFELSLVTVFEMPKSLGDFSV